MPNQNQNQNQEEKMPQISFSTERVTAAPSRTERRMFSNFIQNGRKNLIIGIKSKTPDQEHAVIRSYNKNYILIEFNDRFRSFLFSIYENFNPEHKQRLEVDYQFEDFINTCQKRGYVKCEAIPSEFVKPSFFSHVVQKRGKKILEPLTAPDFNFDKITKAVYVLNVTGCWRSQKMHGDEYRTDACGIKINVSSVVVKSFITAEDEETNNEEKRLENQRLDAIEQLMESDDETTE